MSQSKNDQAMDLDLLEKEIKSRGNIPQHIAVIMDGNGRWAKKRHLPRVAGHRAGRHSVRRTVTACQRLGVETLTLYTFSQENWNRPATEVKALWLFLQEVLGSEIEELRQAGVRLTATGDLDMIPDKARAALNKAIDYLSAGDGLILNLALAYGGRDEIVHAARRAAQRVADGELKPEDITEDVIAEGLFNPGLKDPDLVIMMQLKY